MVRTLCRPSDGRSWRDCIFEAALSALYQEPTIWPRFGLVSPECNGSHLDMNYRLLQRGADAVARYAATSFDLGQSVIGLERNFRHLRHQGLLAERDMLVATGGVNTHKGGIFLLGLLSFALGRELVRTGRPCLRGLFARAAACCRQDLIADLVAKTQHHDLTYGEWVFRKHGMTGVRGVAVGGFTDLLDGLRWLSGRPALSSRLSYGQLRLFFLARSEDTNIVKRGGIAKALEFRNHAIAALKAGGMFRAEGVREILRLEERMLRARCSAAASGDMMILVIFFERLRRDGLLDWPGHPGSPRPKIFDQIGDGGWPWQCDRDGVAHAGTLQVA